MPNTRELKPTNVPCIQCGEPLWRYYLTVKGFNFTAPPRPLNYECRSASNCLGKVTPDDAP
ncbi:hypothetical protein [Rhodococcus qingshengii]|uniref:hypothetical protein n=1 Tax=Rhodococcus qingshengii TaxID=334542 RepID=UPI0022B3DCA3|nr:hypothetical protein [Rhodococcus qingshengii]MCZ4613314.1 hypothetical protein [Rhodococcus qingshengii]